jgi:hypothetical protein
MADALTDPARDLLPSVRTIHDRLTKNERERRRLRTLLKLAIEVRDDAQREANAQAPHQVILEKEEPV